MKKYLTTLILIGIVLFDAMGDGLRLQGLQVLHHTAEVLVLMGFFTLYKLTSFKWSVVWMYLSLRVWMFGLVFNLTAGNKLFYVGDSCLYDKALNAFADLVRQPVGHFAFIFSFMALLVSISIAVKEYRNRF